MPDIRETSVRDATEDTDAADRHRIPNADETAAAVARAQAVLAEIGARTQADATRRPRTPPEPSNSTAGPTTTAPPTRRPRLPQTTNC